LTTFASPSTIFTAALGTYQIAVVNSAPALAFDSIANSTFCGHVFLQYRLRFYTVVLQRHIIGQSGVKRISVDGQMRYEESSKTEKHFQFRIGIGDDL